MKQEYRKRKDLEWNLAVKVKGWGGVGGGGTTLREAVSERARVSPDDDMSRHCLCLVSDCFLAPSTMSVTQGTLNIY